ncbi:MAG: hypothetical protein ABSD08_05980 [Xanthobacteraceae bacterium]|jgi:hypothetical protein
MKLDEIIKTGLWRLDVIKVRTAVNPLLWLVGLITPLIFVTAIIIDDRLIRIGLLAFAALPIIVTIVAYFIFMFRDPDRLQSEEYRLQLKEINLRYRQNRKPDKYNKANQPVQYLDSRARIENGEQE